MADSLEVSKKFDNIGALSGINHLKLLPATVRGQGPKYHDLAYLSPGRIREQFTATRQSYINNENTGLALGSPSELLEKTNDEMFFVVMPQHRMEIIRWLRRLLN